MPKCCCSAVEQANENTELLPNREEAGNANQARDLPQAAANWTFPIMAGVAVSLFAFCFYLIHRLPDPTGVTRQLQVIDMLRAAFSGAVASAFTAATSQTGGDWKLKLFIAFSFAGGLGVIGAVYVLRG